MSAPAVDEGLVVGLIDAMRRDAELALSGVRTTLGTVDGKRSLAAVVKGFYELLGTLGRRLIACQMAITLAMSRAKSEEEKAALVPLLNRTIKLLTYWTALAQGFATYQRPATKDEEAQRVEVGVAPGLVVAVIIVAIIGVGVVAVSLTGVAWAVVHYEQAANLRKEIDLLEADPTMAASLAEINRTAPNSDTPSLPGGGGDGDKGIGFGTVAAGVGILGAIGAAIWYATKPK